MRDTVIGYIPAPGATAIDTPDYFDIRRPPRSFEPREDAKPTTNFDPETGVLQILFNRYGVHEGFVKRSIREARRQHGIEAVRVVDIFVSAETMVKDGAWLIHHGFDRCLDANETTGLYRWRLVRQKKEEAK